ncbi:MAG: tRNA (N(6)-L-threonylcarbamoyladenosine(37)-C(2))-methylthiotransferase MtaB [Melioribacteraceae bacterium]|nr:tRNA (N(6)-L-threonylcarbamoyladenosine(37)-C(2))-methylthiotransferase MtaB [Melioribacteraceae bacterium]
MSAKVAFHTLGCKLNYSETSTIAKQFSDKKYSIVDFNDNADIYVLNTCSVTENAEKECRQIVRKILRKNPDAFVAVTGCYAQLRPEQVSSIEGVDAVLGSHEKFNIFSLLDDFGKRELSCIYVSPTDKLDKFDSSFSTDTIGRTRAFFKIQDGCDYKCSFCTIPLARGKSRSMEPDDVLSQFREFLDNGYKEIILTGVNVGDYGSDRGYNLYGLLKRILRVEGDYRIRISSIEPNLLTDEIIELAAGDKRICSHFHVPLQSGSNHVLRLMQRRYKADYYKSLIYKLAEKIPDVGIGVDVIVGTPGETHEHFIETYNLINELPVSYLHVFTYSERPNTKAAKMAGVVDVSERKKRNSMLRILSEKKKNFFYRNSIGKQTRVLFESELNDGFILGWTDNYIRVKHEYSENLINQFSIATITGSESAICTVNITTDELVNNDG